MIRSVDQESTDVFQGYGNKVPTLQICLSNLNAEKQLMSVPSMWSVGSLVNYSIGVCGAITRAAKNILRYIHSEVAGIRKLASGKRNLERVDVLIIQ